MTIKNILIIIFIFVGLYVVLDFRDISTVGQGFVDEIFRVFKTKYSGTKIEYKNANDNVQFMIERGLN